MTPLCGGWPTAALRLDIHSLHPHIKNLQVQWGTSNKVSRSRRRSRIQASQPRSHCKFLFYYWGFSRVSACSIHTTECVIHSLILNLSRVVALHHLSPPQPQSTTVHPPSSSSSSILYTTI